MTPKQQKILDHLLLLAHDSVKTARAKIVAAIVKNNKVISYGFNQNKTHTLQARYTRRYQAVYIHAEIDAIKNALRKIPVEDFVKCDLYVARSRYVAGEKKVLISGLAKPCLGCQKAIVAFGFRNVFYTE